MSQNAVMKNLLYQKVQENNQFQQNNSTDVSISELISRIKKWYRYIVVKRITVLIFVLIGAILSYCYASYRKPIYTAECSFVLEDSEGAGGGGAMSQFSGIASMVGVDLGGNGGGIFRGDNIIQLYTSRTMLQKALLSPIKNAQGETILLINRYIDINGWKKKKIDDAKLKDLVFLPSAINLTRDQDSIINKIVEDLNTNYLSVVKPDKKLNIYKVIVKARDEAFAKDFNDQIVKTVNDFFVQTKTKKSIENLSILQHQTDSVRRVLDGAIVKSVAVNDATPNLNPTRQLLRVPVQRSQFNAEANKVILTQLVQNLELAKITLRKETPLIQVIDAPVYPLPKNKLSRAISLVVGGVLGGFIIVLILTFKYVGKALLDS